MRLTIANEQDTYEVVENTRHVTTFEVLIDGVPFDAAVHMGTLSFATKYDSNRTFSIDSSTGMLNYSRSRAPNFEDGNDPIALTVVITFTPSDGSALIIKEHPFHVAVTDDGPPINSATTAMDIDENNAEDIVGVYTATSTEESVTWSIADGDESQYFTIDASTGVVTFTGRANFEDQSSYTFTVIATGSDDEGFAQDVTMAVNNVDEKPSLTLLSEPAVAYENTDSIVARFDWSDPDDTMSTTSIRSIRLDGIHKDYFQINFNTGVGNDEHVVRLLAGRTLDVEEPDVSLTISTSSTIGSDQQSFMAGESIDLDITILDTLMDGEQAIIQHDQAIANATLGKVNFARSEEATYSVTDADGEPSTNFIVNGDGFLVIKSEIEEEVSAGSYQLTLTSSTGDTANITVKVNDLVRANDAPIESTIYEGTAIDISSSVLGLDEQDDPLDFVAAADTTDNGSYVISEAGVLTYTPNNGFTGTDTFDVDITDSDGGTATQEITITVASAIDIGATASTLMTREDSDWLDPTGHITLADQARTGEYELTIITTADTGTVVEADATVISTEHGWLTVDMDGTWSYELDNSHEKFDMVNTQHHLIDTVEVKLIRANDPLTDIDESETLTRSFNITIDGLTDIYLDDDESTLDESEAMEGVSLHGNSARINELTGGSGDDVLEGTSYISRLHGGDGDDALIASSGITTFYGGDGNDRLDGSARDGNPKGYSIYNWAQTARSSDAAIHLDMNDATKWKQIEQGRWESGTGEGYDYIRAWIDLDTDNDDPQTDEYDYLRGVDKLSITTTSSGSEISGGDGHDRLTGGSGNDIFSGNGGRDTLRGNGGNDVLDGGAGRDYLFGNDGDDVLDGGAEADYLSGGDDNDVLDGGAGNDYLYGNDGNDALDGGADTDTIFGEDGDDILDGGAGKDYLFGGGGDDIFVLDLNRGTDDWDNIYDFSSGTVSGSRSYNNTTRGGNDKIRVDIDDTTVTTLADLKFAANIRWTSDTSHDRSDDSSLNFLFANRTNDTIIYDTQNTESTADDVILMVLEDFTAPLTLAHFITSDIDITGSFTAREDTPWIDPTGTISLTYPNRAVADYTATTTANYGTVTVDMDGTWSYDLDNALPIFNTLDSDDDSLIDTVTITLTRANDPMTHIDESETFTRSFTITIDGLTDHTLGDGSILDRTKDLSLHDSGTGGNTLTGGSGDDVLRGLADSSLHGEAGDDWFMGGTHLYGGTGNDVYTDPGQGSHSIVYLESAGNIIDVDMSASEKWKYDTAAETWVFGTGDGYDYIRAWIYTASDQDDDRQPADGDEYDFIHQNFSNIRGGAESDKIISGSGHSVIYGYGGNDTLELTGTGSIFAGEGNDVLRGGDGSNTLRTTLLRGDAGDDHLIAGSGYTNLVGGGGNDKFDGSATNDATYSWAHPSSSEDTAIHLDLTDTVKWKQDGQGAWTSGTGEGYDYIRAWIDLDGDGILELDDDEFDYLLGIDHLEIRTTTSGNHQISGGAKADTLAGHDGNDVFAGNGGADTIRGGKGNDIFVLNLNGGTGDVDTVQDFSSGTVSGDRDYNGTTDGGNDRIRVDIGANTVTTLTELKSAANINWTTGARSTTIYATGDTESTADDVTLMVLEGFTAPLTLAHFDTSGIDITSSATIELNENNATGVAVYTAQANSTHGVVTWSIADGDDPSNTKINKDFSIDSANGVVTFNKSADYESQSTYSFIITATNAAGSTTQTVTLGIGDRVEAPVFTSGGTASIVENNNVGAVVYRTAVSGSPTGTPVTYALTGDDSNAFSIDTNGVVTLNESADYDTKSSYDFTITASNSAGSSTQQVNIAVTLEIDVTGTFTAREDSPWFDPAGTIAPADTDRTLSDYTATAAASYGTVTIDNNSAWSYVLDNTNATVEALNSGRTLTDTVTVTLTRADDLSTTGIDESETFTRSFDITIDGLTDYYLADDATTLDKSRETDDVSLHDNSRGWDTLTGGSGDDVLHGNRDSVLHGGAGDDVLIGGSGITALRGEGGNDVLDGSAGYTTYQWVRQDATEDMAFHLDMKDTTKWKQDNQGVWTSGKGEDFTYIRAWTDLDGDNRATEADEFDYLLGINRLYVLTTSADNEISGGDINDYLQGADGNDIFYGNGGNDKLYGGGGNDVLDGGAGSDILYGGTDNDVLDGGAGRDSLYGEGGDDIFVLNLSGGVDDLDTVRDFSFGTVSGDSDYNGTTNGGNDKIRVDIGASYAGTLAGLKFAANIDWTTTTNRSGDSANDTIIYNTLGTEDISDDIELMVLEDYTALLTLEHFDIVTTAPPLVIDVTGSLTAREDSPWRDPAGTITLTNRVLSDYTVTATTSNSYGTVTINTDGAWSYRLSNTLRAVEALDSGGTLTDTVAVTLTSGDEILTHSFTITIDGLTDYYLVDDATTLDKSRETDDLSLHSIDGSYSARNSVSGGSGNDVLHGANYSILYGGAGDDWLIAGSSSDRLYGGAGNDVYMRGQHGGSAIYLESAGSNIEVDMSSSEKWKYDRTTETWTSGTGDEYEYIRAWIYTESDQDGDDRQPDKDDEFDFIHQSFSYIRGGDGKDKITSGHEYSVIYGYGGNDTLEIKGSGHLFGDAGNDVLIAGTGSTHLYGGHGNDKFDGSASSSATYRWSQGTRSEDVAFHLDMNDEVKWKQDDQGVWTSGKTPDFTYIRAWIDLDGDGIVEQDDEFDYLLSIETLSISISSGNNEISGGNGNDWLSRINGYGNDVFYGGAGEDYLGGWRGNDVLNGGAGEDELWGGRGNDIFVLNLNGTANDIDTVKDFSSGTVSGTYNGTTRGGDDKIRVDTADGDETTLEALKSAANIRWTNTTNHSEHDTGYYNDSDIYDTIIYNTRDTVDTSDDIELMVLEDYTALLTIANFDIV